MYQLFQQFFQIAFFKTMPQELPGQPIVLWVSIASAFVTGTAGLLFAYDLAESLWRSTLALLIPAVVVFLILKFRGLQHRFIQTYSAMCGSAAVIYVLAFPLMPYFFNADADTGSGKWMIMVVLLIDIWALMITAYIFKHALGVVFSTGISLSIALMLITLLLMESLAPRSVDIDTSTIEVSTAVNPTPTLNRTLT